MSFDVNAIGRAGDEQRFDVTEDALRAYAEATDDVLGGPVFAIVPVWETVAPASRSVASEEARRQVVHYAQDMLLHQPIKAGMRLVSRATPLALLGRPNGTALVINTETRTEDGQLVNEQYVTEFFRGIQTDENRGDHGSDHRLQAEGDPVAEVAHVVADDQSNRYAAASGDDFAIHLDDNFAREVGLPGRILHGLCTMAFAGRAVAEASGSEPAAIKRLAVRFSAPVFPGDTVTTRVWQINGAFGFEALNGDGKPVIKDGLAELR